MTRKTFALLFTIPLMLFFLCSETNFPRTNKLLFEVGSEMPTDTQKVYYLLPENELTIPENKELSMDRKYKLKDPYKFRGKRFVK